jgi:hypothetical protein
MMDLSKLKTTTFKLQGESFDKYDNGKDEVLNK